MKPLVKTALYRLQKNRDLQKDIWVIWEKTSQEFDIHLSQYHYLYPLSTLSFTDKALMLPFPSACIPMQENLKLKKLSISHPLSPPLLPLSVSAGDNNTDSI